MIGAPLANSIGNFEYSHSPIHPTYHSFTAENFVNTLDAYKKQEEQRTSGI
jgi:hypothetical protein